MAAPSIAPALISGGSSIVGDLISGGFSAWGQSRANRESRRAAQRAMDFQERMFRNRYTYTMEDMRRAGLNPILAYQQGGGTAPGGSSYTAGNVAAGAADAVGRMTSSALSALRGRKELDLLNAQIKNVQQDTEVKKEDVWLKNNQGGESLARWNILGQQFENAKASAEGAKHLQQLYKDPKWGPLLKTLEGIGRSLNPGASAVKNLR